jgi:hypothetical protein
VRPKRAWQRAVAFACSAGDLDERNISVFLRKPTTYLGPRKIAPVSSFLKANLPTQMNLEKTITYDLNKMSEISKKTLKVGLRTWEVLNSLISH